jgi:transketolase
MSVDLRDALFDTVYELAARDPRVVFLTADADAHSLQRFKTDFPERFINVGVAEQNMVTVATGLALSGKRVFMYAILSFATMRCFEQIKFNICGMNLPVTIIGLGTGFSFEFDGPTHHGVVDVGVMRMLPEIAIYNPSSAALAAHCVRTAYESGTPALIRLDKGLHPVHELDDDARRHGFHTVVPGRRLCLVATGVMVHAAVVAADLLRSRDQAPAVLDVWRLKPLDVPALTDALAGFDAIVSIEEHVLNGGLGTLLAELRADVDARWRLLRLGVPDVQSLVYGTRPWLLAHYGLDAPAVADTVGRWCAHRPGQ